MFPLRSSLARSSYVVSSNTSLRLFSSYPNPRNNAFDATFSYPIFAVNVVVPNPTAPHPGEHLRRCLSWPRLPSTSLGDHDLDLAGRGRRRRR